MTINRGEIQVKTPNVLQGMLTYSFHPMLVTIIEFVARHYGVVITESYRPQRHPDDLHGVHPVRAMDIRSWCYPEWLAEQIRDDLNNEWTYDPTRTNYRVAKIHDSGLGIHFHIQVHPRTVRN